MEKLTKQLPKNTKGRDFVIGDLHANVDLLWRFIDWIGFDSEVDRMISVGDLIDRGEFNIQSLELLNEPWFHAVRGNHDQMMIDAVLFGKRHSMWMSNGGTWSIHHNKEDLQHWAAKLDELPLVISVQGSFHVIHAEVRGVALTNEDLESNTLVNFINEGNFLESNILLWSRKIFDRVFDCDLSDEIKLQRIKRVLLLEKVPDIFDPNLLPIFCGHTPVRQPTQIGKLINIDTAAFLTGRTVWAGLTVAHPESGKFWKVADDIKETNMVKVLCQKS